jgi:hypothetical protein
MPYPYRSRTASFQRTASLVLAGGWILLFCVCAVYLIIGKQGADFAQWLGIH